MTTLVFLSPKEKRQFDSPPKLKKEERPIYFTITSDIRRTLGALKTPVTKVGFVLQLGYFKASAKFYTYNQFRANDINFVKTLLGINEDLDFSSYQNTAPAKHRQRILKLLDWTPFDTLKEHVQHHIALLTQQQLTPPQILLSAADFCWKNKIEVPSYHTLSTLITDSFNNFEDKLIGTLADALTDKHSLLLDEYISQSADERGSRPPLTKLRRINQSLRALDIKNNVETCETFAKHYYEFEDVIDKLALTDQASEYFAVWVQKADTFQLQQFPDPNKAYLHLLAYFKHQYYCRQDALVDIFLKSAQSTLNAANKSQTKNEHKSRSERNKAIKALSKAHKDAKTLVKQIALIVKATQDAPHEKVQKIETLIDDYEAQQNELEKLKLAEFEKQLDSELKNQSYYDALESLSLKIQRKVSSILKILVFNEDTSDAHLLEAIEHFKSTDGNLGSTPPLDFLSEKENAVFEDNGPFRISLYKVLLFIHVSQGIKSGRLNLKYSYRYRAIQEYLIDSQIWHQQKERLLKIAGLEKFADGVAYLETLKETLNKTYETVNKRYLDGENELLKIDEQGQVTIRTPRTDYDDTEFIANSLSTTGHISILQILNEVNAVSDFAKCFKHHSVKHSKMKPALEAIMAGIIGKGCNIGIRKLASISVGISEDSLVNTVNWCFDLKNIQSANTKIVEIINRLALANVFKRDPDHLHSSSDGRKVIVAVDSLHANYSYKYFGKDKGVAIYTFIDERHILFHSTVISASDREAAFVIDGLLQNDVVRSHIHSTDTHGFTESIFAATHFIDTAFAPRLKRIGNQTLYGFAAKSTYQKRGYAIVPSRSINHKLILRNWDDILRFMATIKLKHTSASQLFKRLSSYAKDHPLYQALKEFGRIIKTNFILTYYDDLELRQRIEKQLNKIELSNKFSKAVFFANNQEFQEGTKEEQEIATACKVLIQNTIVLWNYLYLSQQLVEMNDDEKIEALSSIKKGSLISWRHVNLQGEYDFTAPAANESEFDLERIYSLKVS